MPRESTWQGPDVLRRLADREPTPPPRRGCRPRGPRTTAPPGGGRGLPGPPARARPPEPHPGRGAAGLELSRQRLPRTLKSESSRPLRGSLAPPPVNSRFAQPPELGRYRREGPMPLPRGRRRAAREFDGGRCTTVSYRGHIETCTPELQPKGPRRLHHGLVPWPH